MLPMISTQNLQAVMEDVLKDLHGWRKTMIHYIKEENPELNSAIIEIAQKSDLDPKAVAAGAYVTYKLLENEMQNDAFNLDEE